MSTMDDYRSPWERSPHEKPVLFAAYLVILEDVPRAREHHSLYICVGTNPPNGFIYRVCGYINTNLGMQYSHQPCQTPADEMFFKKAELLGYVEDRDYLEGRVMNIVHTVPVPRLSESLSPDRPGRVEIERRLAEQSSQTEFKPEMDWWSAPVSEDHQWHWAREWTADVIAALWREGVLREITTGLWIAYDREDAMELDPRDLGGDDNNGSEGSNDSESIYGMGDTDDEDDGELLLLAE